MTDYESDQSSSLLTETLNCLTKSFTSKNTKEIQQAEERLMELEKDIVTHIKEILLVFAQGNLNLDLKKSILIYLKNVLKIRLKENRITKEKIIEIVNYFIELFISGGFSDAVLSNVSPIITDLLSSNVILEDNQIICQLCESLKQYMLSKQNTHPSSFTTTCKPIIILFQIIISSKCTNYENVYQLISSQTTTIDHMISLFIEAQAYIDNVETAISLYTGVRQVFDYLFLSLLKLKKMDRISDVLDMYVAKYVSFAGDMIFKADYMNINNEVTSGTMPRNMIYFTGLTSLDDIMNSMKAKALQLVAFMIQNAGKEIKSEMIDICYKIVDLLTLSLDSISNDILRIFSQYQENICYDALIYQMMLFLSRVFTREPFISQFTPLVKNFVVNILFPFFSSSKKEVQQLQVEGDSYHLYILDLCHGHKLKHMKTASSYLLVRLCEKYDELPIFVLNLCLQIIDYALCDDKTDANTRYPILAENSEKVLTLPLEAQLDASLLIICILSTYLMKSQQFRDALRYIIESHQNKLHNVNSPIIQEKLCMVYGLFLDEIYSIDILEKSTVYISLAFEFLFKQAMAFKDLPGLSFQALNAIAQLITSKDFQIISSQVVRKLLPSLIPLVKEIEIDIFFDMLTDIVSSLDIEDFLLDLSKCVTDRILIEITSSRPLDKKRMNVYINKCLHLLQTVVENYEIYTDNKNIFDEILQPVIKFLKNPMKIEYDVEILSLLVTILKCAKRTTPNVKLIFPYLEKYLIKHEDMTEELFQLLNLVVLYDNNEKFLLNEEIMTSFCKMIFYGLNIESEFDNSPLFSLMLIQSWLLIPNYEIPEKIVAQLISFAIDKVRDMYEIYKENFETLNGHFDSYVFSSYITTIYSGILKYPVKVFSILNEKNLISQLSDWSEMMSMLEFFSVLQSKIILLGLCKILSDKSYVISLSSLINKFLSLTFGLLVRQRQEESRKLKQMTKEDFENNSNEGCLYCSAEEEENEDDIEKDSFDLTQYNQFKKNAKKIHSTDPNDSNIIQLNENKLIHDILSKGCPQLQGYDEFDIFSRTLQDLIGFNQDIYNNWISLLTEKDKKLWEEMIHTRRIKVLYKDSSIDIPRRTVKLKKTGN